VSVTWDDFPGPRHEDEVMASHEGAPSLAVQSETHGVPMPEPDRGTDDNVKYGPGGAC
jgi:hypothetical protein